MNAHKMAPRTSKRLQERAWDTPTKGLMWVLLSRDGHLCIELFDVDCLPKTRVVLVWGSGIRAWGSGLVDWGARCGI